MKILFENWQKFLDEDNHDLEDPGGAIDMGELVEEHDLDYEGEPIGFFLSLVRAVPSAFMEQREQDLTEEMRQAVAKILTEASTKSEPGLDEPGEEDRWAAIEKGVAPE